MYRSHPVSGDVSEEGYGHTGQRQRSGSWRHVGEAQPQSSIPPKDTVLHPQMNLLVDFHWAVAEHETVSERAPRPLCESTPLAHADPVTLSRTVEAQRTEAGRLALV